MNRPTVAVITASSGRAELVRAMASVQAQSYTCKHYVFANGTEASAAVREAAEAFPKAVITHLPAKSGSSAAPNGAVYAAAPFLVQEDIICYLDETHFYDPQHVAGLVAALQQTGADYAYSLRNFVDGKGRLICRDDSESLGSWPSLFYNKNLEFNFDYNGTQFSCTRSINTEHHIDGNCYAFTRQTALAAAPVWYQTGAIGSDRAVFRFLSEHAERFESTGSGLYTLNYCADAHSIDSGLMNALGERFKPEQINEISQMLRRRTNEMHIEAYGGTPWAK